jgi:hypothetical protein
MTSGPQCNSNFIAPRHSRRGIITALTSAAVLLPSARLVAAANATADDERFMRIALDEARQGDFPFGAVIVRDGQVLARGRNLGRTNGDPTAHGEMMAIRRCVADHGRAALRGSTLYTTGEPCAMCMGAILWCRVRSTHPRRVLPGCRRRPIPPTTKRVAAVLVQVVHMVQSKFQSTLWFDQADAFIHPGPG